MRRRSGRYARAAAATRPHREPGKSVCILVPVCYVRFGFLLTGCSSDWQSAAFGTQKSLVQIQSPRLSFCWRSIRLAFVGGVVAAAAVGASAAPAEAENVSARSGEIVAREAPGTGQAGIAVLRGNDRVKLLGQRDGWSEILLSDGRRAWVPTAEITHVSDAPRPTEIPVAAPTPVATPVETDANLRDLATEVARLRRVTDDLTTWRTNLPDAAPAAPIPEAIPWALGGAGLVVGIVIGGLVERRRGRRERSLRF